MIKLSFEKNLEAAEGNMLLQLETEIKKHSFTALYGPSGAGKTSVLRILAGLMSPDRGKISAFGEEWLDTDQGINRPPQQRKAGLVFQEFSLFPNMTVRQNLEFAAGRDDHKIINELIEITALGDLQYRMPATLSGGQRQRTALARALVQRPSILMLDEPLSALDHVIRAELQTYMVQLHRQYGLTTIIVSHDISEIIKMCDRIIFLDHGKIVKEGAPFSVFADDEISGKFQLVGEIIKKTSEDFMVVLSILYGQQFVKIIADKSEVEHLKVGDKVMVASSAFNPIIRKI